MQTEITARVDSCHRNFPEGVTELPCRSRSEFGRKEIACLSTHSSLHDKFDSAKKEHRSFQVEGERGNNLRNYLTLMLTV